MGLRSGAVFMEEYGVRFDRILSDMSGRRPYADESVNGVIANGSIHHAHDLSSVVAEAHRVLSPGGRLAIVEATTGVVWHTDRDFGQYEKGHFGWNEHVYPVGTYQRLARRAGFRFRHEPTPSTRAKLAAVPGGRLGNVRGLKFALGRLAAPVLRTSATRQWVLGPVYPLVNRVIDTQIVGVAENAA